MTERSVETTTSDCLARRLAMLETSLDHEKTRRRRMERFLVGGALLAAGLGAMAASGLSNVADVIQTHRLEIVDDNDKVVMLATAARHGGRIDVWDAAQRNIARLSGNGLGGDFTLFDRQGRRVAGVYAAETSARIEVNNPDNGSAAALLTADERGGMVTTSNAQGVRGARMSCENGSGLVAVGTPERDLAILDMNEASGRVSARPRQGEGMALLEGEAIEIVSGLHTLASLDHTEDGGRLLLRDLDGKLRLSGIAEANGGRLETLDDKARARVALGIGTGGTGLRIRNSDDKVILAFGEESQGSGALEISDQEGNRCLTMGVGEIAGRILVDKRDGLPALAFGGSRNGGRIDVKDRDGDTVATLQGLDGGARIGVASEDRNSGIYLDVPKNESPTLVMFTPIGRSIAMAATANGGMVNLHDASGDVAVVVGCDTDNRGGLVSIRNDNGQEVVRAGIKKDGEGIIEVHNEIRTRKRSLSAP